ncbi:hypothetical protein M0657_010978 [Pyricularia oryzae]|uniref:Zn(2)-C6 fungal-type domain-containing protein n=2 Tax=Pyricularia oryzae TaxID=318829 RepID=A0AA97NPP0_PYRO3|nr:hypothetical protein OOU_Y34scaffold00798g7 [Pyricularia oryzae Y34]KAI7911392.1 hypothetical protein M0657_010978 [Pyricularia oryzae]KAI7926195.1 hypothetical protein M9X92_002940 [Pyricularia oryzae]
MSAQQTTTGGLARPQHQPPCRACHLASRQCHASTRPGGGPCDGCAREGTLCSLPSAFSLDDGPVVCTARDALNDAPLDREAQRRWDFLATLATLLREGVYVVPSPAARLLDGFGVVGWDAVPDEGVLRAAAWAVGLAGLEGEWERDGEEEVGQVGQEVEEEEEEDEEEEEEDEEEDGDGGFSDALIASRLPSTNLKEEERE